MSNVKNNMKISEGDSCKKLDPAISLIRVIAMMLIIISHSDQLFPPSISFIATGGALGNELFFFVGGYLFSLKRGILKTARKRFIRLYLPTYLMTIVLFVIGKIHLNEFTKLDDWFHLLIWPSSFWFVSAIFFDGILASLLVKIKAFDTKIRAWICLVLLALVDVVVYIFFIENKQSWVVEDYKLLNGSLYYKCIYSFIVFLLGYLVKQDIITLPQVVRQKMLPYQTVASLMVFYAFKAGLKIGIIPMQLQLISQLLTVLCIISVWQLCTQSEWVKTWCLRHETTQNMINQLGMITLEAFLVQFEIIDFFVGLNIIFPIGFICSCLTVIVSAFIFHKINERLMATINSFIN